MSSTGKGLSNIDNNLYEICKDMDIDYREEDVTPNGHIVSENAILTGSIFPHGRYEDTEGYSNEDDGSFDRLMKSIKEEK